MEHFKEEWTFSVDGAAHYIQRRDDAMEGLREARTTEKIEEQIKQLIEGNKIADHYKVRQENLKQQVKELAKEWEELIATMK